MSFKPKFCFIIPVYDHSKNLFGLVEELAKKNFHIFLVDDGSHDDCKKIMMQLDLEIKGLTLKSHALNLGKGAAIKTGLKEAKKSGYSHAIQIDADGQHNIEDISRFIAEVDKQPNALISGFPTFDKTVPKLRYYSRYATHFWVWVNTLSKDIKDSMCGFRIYPVNQSCLLLSKQKIGDRMEFDTEFMVRWHWTGNPIIQIQTRVTYPKDGISHFRVFRDNLLISWMHVKLFFGMLRRFLILLNKKF